MDTLPNNTNAERALLSLVTVDAEKFAEVADLLSPQDFYVSTHQEIWSAMLRLFKQGQDLDIVSIKSELVKQNVDPQPAMDDLIDCYQEVGVGGNALVFVKEIKNKSMLRRIIGIANKQALTARLESSEAQEILNQFEQELIDVADMLNDDHPIDAKGIVDEVHEDMIRGQEQGWKGFESGFEVLDNQTGGLIPTQCWIVGAYTGTGKTFFLLQIILNILEKGAKVILFSTEMDRKMNMMRLLGNLAGLGTLRILKGTLDDDEKRRIDEAREKLSTYKDSLAIYDNVYTTEEIRLKAKKRKLRQGLDVVVVDFIQNLRGAESIYDRMSNASVALQHIAQELNVAMVIASQVNQAAANWQSKEAIEYKGAGEIAAIADVALWIKRVEEDKNVRQVVIRKARHGLPARFNVRMTFPSGRVINMFNIQAGEADG